MLTPEHHSLPTAAEILQDLGENMVVQEIIDMWDRFTSGTDVLQCHSSNELIEDIYRTHQEYITGLISPVTTLGHVCLLCVPL